MPIHPDAVGNTSEPSELSWTSKDSLLYALGVGAGVTDPTGFELEFTTENTKDTAQKALPTQVVVMGTGGGLDFGDFNLAALLHGEQFIPFGYTCSEDSPSDPRLTCISFLLRSLLRLRILSGEKITGSS